MRLQANLERYDDQCDKHVYEETGKNDDVSDKK